VGTCRLPGQPTRLADSFTVILDAFTEAGETWFEVVTAFPA